jgi:phosphotransferase system enzyme I (PtsI)
MTILRGICGAKGYCSGEAVVKKPIAKTVERRHVADTAGELARFRAAQAVYVERVRGLAESAGETVGAVAAEIFRAYEAMVRDDIFLEQVFARLEDERCNIEYALLTECSFITAVFDSIEDDYMRERGKDIENIVYELLNLMAQEKDPFLKDVPPETGCVLVAENLTPEEMLRLDRSLLRGLVTEFGGATSHTVILAKALGIPAIVGVEQAAIAIKDGDLLQLNAFTGTVTVNPTGEDRAEHFKYEEDYRQDHRHSERAAREPAVTLDGFAVSVGVNTGDPVSLAALDPESCDGIGLFRTEYIFLNANALPGEQEQFEIYRDAVIKARGKEVMFRTMDTGGDKSPSFMRLPAEENPLMGYRAIRLCLDNREMFGVQLRALLRASAYGRVRLMFPLIVTQAELREAKACLEREKRRLRRERVPFDENIPVGIMVETPAAVMISDRLAWESAFFSVGTNDLIQYTTACDRMNPRVQGLFDPCSPAVLRMLQIVSESAAAAQIPWGICGEAAGEERLVPLWVALGASQLSVSAGMVGPVKRVIGAISREEAREWLGSAMLLDSPADINAYLDNILTNLIFRKFLQDSF